MKCPHCSEGIDDVVPRDRLNAKNDRIRELEASLAEASSKVEGVDALARRAAEAETALEQTRAEFEAFRAESTTSSDLLRAGITEAEDQELVRWRYSKLGEEAPPFSEWLAGAAREDRHVSRLFSAPDPAAPVEAVAEVAAVPPPSAPPSNAGAKVATNAPPPRYSPAEVASMPLDALREALAAGAFK